MARSPILPIKITPHGRYGQERTDASDGACGIHGYPCTHWGVDLAGSIGDDVVAPCDAWVIASVGSVAGNPLPRPWRGYDPSIVLLAHDDGDAGEGVISYRYSLLAHLEPTSLRYSIVPDDDFLSSQSGDDYKIIADGTKAARQLRAGADAIVHVAEGEFLGQIGAARHTHWEVRISPLGSGANGTMDPLGWLEAQGVAVKRTDDDDDGPSPLLLLGGLWLAHRYLGRGRGRRGRR